MPLIRNGLRTTFDSSTKHIFRYILLKRTQHNIVNAEGGRNKVLQSGVKNVHAGLSGYLVKTVPNIPEVSYDVSYNPFKYNSFVSVENKKPIQHSDYAYLEAGQKYRNVEAIFDIDKVENCITI